MMIGAGAMADEQLMRVTGFEKLLDVEEAERLLEMDDAELQAWSATSPLLTSAVRDCHLQTLSVPASSSALAS